MKKLLCCILCLVMVIALASCGGGGTEQPSVNDGNTNNNVDNTQPETVVMTYEEYMAAEIQAPITVDVYVQATQSWWDNKITVYAADFDGAYFIYEMACSEEDAAKLTLGTKIRVSGFKAEWSGEIEIVERMWRSLTSEASACGAKGIRSPTKRRSRPQGEIRRRRSTATTKCTGGFFQTRQSCA